MIIVKIFQGLGNQLFQYSLSRSLQLRHGVQVKLDLTWFDEYSEHRPFGLDKFNTKFEIATQKEINQVKNGIYPNKLSQLLNNKLSRFKKYYHQPYFKEDLSKLDSNILKINSRTYVEGYFSSDYFFKDYRGILLKEITLINQPNEVNQNWIRKIKSSNSVALTVRRGDFIGNPLHDVCDINYFHTAINEVTKHVENPVFFIFSDDLKWTKENLKIDKEHFLMGHNYPNFYEDMRLISNCKHHIIPNSTFSWWGAWLADYPGKIVVAPKTWLNSASIDYSYFLPKDWIKIDNFQLLQ